MSANRNLELALLIRTAVQGAESVEDLQRRFDELIDELQRGEDQARDTDRSFGDLGDSASKLGDVFQTLAGLAVVQQFVEINRRAESLKNTLIALTGSQQKAAEEIEWLTQTATRLGVAVGDVSQAYISLSTSSKGTQLEGQKTRDIFESIIGAMATMGRTGPEAEQAITAIAQMMGKGVIQAEELTGQLEEALPGASRALAAALGVSVAELREMSEAGTLLSSDVLPALAAELKKTYGESASGANTMSAQLARLKNAVTAVFTQIGESGALQAFKEGTIMAAVGGRTLYGVLELLGTAAGALMAAIANMDFSQFDQTLKDTSDRINRENAAIAQYSDTLAKINPELRKTAESTKVLASAQDGASASTEKAGGSLAKLQYQYQQLNEKMERTLALLDRQANAHEAWANVLKNEAELQGDIVKQTQLSIDIAARDAAIKQKQATEMARLAAEAERNVKNLMQQVNITPQVIKAAEEDAIAKQKQADSAAAAATAAKLQADAVKGANTIILQALGQQGESAEAARAKAEQLRAEYQQMRAAGASLDQLAIKMNEVVKAEEAARIAARGYREEQAITIQQLGQLKGKLDGSAEAQSAYNAALQKFAQQQQTASDQLSRRNGLIEQARAADIAATRAAADLAEARGNEAEAGRLRVVALEQELSLTRDQIAMRQAEKKALEEIVATKEREADTDKVRTQEEQASIQSARDAVTEKQNQIAATEASVKSKEAEIEATRNQATADEEAAEAAKKAAEEQAAAAEKAKEHAAQLKAQGEFMSDALNGWRDRLEALSPAAQSAFDSAIHFAGGAKQAADASHEAQKASDALGKTITQLGSTGMVEWANQLAVNAQKVEASFWSQAAAAEAMTEQLAQAAESGSSNLGALVHQAETTIGTFDLLDQTRLDHLQAEIDDARQRMEELRQASEDALSAAQEALLQQQNDQVGLIELQRKQKVLELEQQINEAKATGDAESLKRLQEALAIQQQVYDLKLKDAKAEADKKNTTSTTTNTSNGSGDGSSSTSGSGGKSGDTINNFYLTGMATGDFVRKELLPEINKVANLRR